MLGLIVATVMKNYQNISKDIARLFFRLVGDVLLATGFLSYLGPFNQNFRNLLLSRWEKEMSAKKIPFSDDLNLINLLTDAATVSKVERLQLWLFFALTLLPSIA